MEKIAVYPGTFDPPTYGHIDLIQRASKMYDKLYVIVSANTAKNALFTVEERIEMLEFSLKDLDNVYVDVCHGLTIDYAAEKNAKCLIRGLRAVTDFEYELQMASANRTLNKEIESIYLMTNPKYSFYSSSLIKEIAMFNGNIDKFAPIYICNKLREKLKK